MTSLPSGSPERVKVEDGWEGSCAEHGREVEPGCTVCSILTRADHAQQSAVRAAIYEAQVRSVDPGPWTEPPGGLLGWEIPARWQTGLALAALVAFAVVFR
jgi:hypothetical protein